MITTLIWDAGGTLFDSYPAVVRAFATALSEWGHTLPSEELLSLTRRSRNYAAQTLARHFALDAEALLAAFHRQYSALPPTEQPPFPGARELCTYIRAHGGRNFIVTHREHASLMALLETHTMLNEFTALITQEDPYPRKPAPDALNALVQRYALDRSATLAIGDREIDIAAARAAGLRACYFGAPPAPDGIEIAVQSYKELQRIIQRENERQDLHVFHAR